MKTKKLIAIHQKCLDNNLPFVTWRVPDSSTCETIISPKAVEHHNPDFQNLEGFIAAPFEFATQKRVWVFPVFYHFYDANFDLRELDEIHSIPRAEHKEICDTEYSAYENHFHHFKQLIEQGTLQKGVLSRVKTCQNINRSKAAELYQRLCHEYPHAMVYIFNIPEKGLWIGATPESLLRLEKRHFITESIAATHITGATRKPWSDKEISEQEIVTDYIRDKLEESGINIYRMAGPMDHLAGNVEHLKTEFEIPAESLIPVLTKFVTALHPTPAVCGIPKEAAFEQILNTENHDREFYSGFLGVTGLKNNMQLFVNLRCMQVFDSYAALYVGGGLTIDSVLEEEWQETEYKAETLLNIAYKV